MIRSILLSCVFFYLQYGFGQSTVPQKVNYQAVARNAAGVPLQNQQIAIKAEILDADQSTILYGEAHTTVTNAFGLFTLSIGGGTVLQGSFPQIDWGKGNRYIRTSADLAGGTNFQLMGTSQLLSVPYALHALRADSVKTPDPAVQKTWKRIATYQYLKL